MHPYETEGFREAARAIRQMGQDCILRRFKAIANNEEVPDDILTQIIRAASSDKGVNIEDLVDDFATFYVAGIVYCMAGNFHGVQFSQMANHFSDLIS